MEKEELWFGIYSKGTPALLSLPNFLLIIWKETKGEYVKQSQIFEDDSEPNHFERNEQHLSRLFNYIK